jgi:hypothetical protein
MALPTAYFTSGKNVADILAAIQTAKAPEKFTQAFLEALGFKSTSDRLAIGVLKALGFLDDAGKPTQRYFDYLDQSQGPRILAEGIRDAWSDLFAINVNAERMSREDFTNKVRTLSQGSLSDSVLDKMSMTFSTLVKLADFTAPQRTEPIEAAKPAVVPKVEEAPTVGVTAVARPIDLVYNIQIHLPESRDPAVYDALFKSLKDHLL